MLYPILNAIGGSVSVIYSNKNGYADQKRIDHTTKKKFFGTIDLKKSKSFCENFFFCLLLQIKMREKRIER